MIHPRHKRINKLNSQKGVSVVFAIVGFMFAAMIALVVVSAAFSNAMKAKKQRYEEQSFLVAQSMAGIVSDALSGESLGVDVMDVSSGLTLSYQYIENVDPDTGTTAIYYREGTEDVNYTETSGPATFVEGSGASVDKSYHNVKGLTLGSDSAALSMRKLIKLMAREIDTNGSAADATVETTTTIDGVVCKATATLSMSEDYKLTVLIEGVAGTKGKYAATVTARANVASDKPQVSGGKLSDDKTTITIDSIGSSTVDVSSGKQLYKVITRTVKWPASQIKTAASQVH